MAAAGRGWGNLLLTKESKSPFETGFGNAR